MAPIRNTKRTCQEINNEVDFFFVRINNEVDFLVVDSIKIAIQMVYAIGKH